MAGPASRGGYVAELGFELEATWFCVLVPKVTGLARNSRTVRAGSCPSTGHLKSSCQDGEGGREGQGPFSSAVNRMTRMTWRRGRDPATHGRWQGGASGRISQKEG